MKTSTLLLSFLGACVCSLGDAQYEALYSDNGIGWRGESGPQSYCHDTPNDTSYTYALDFKYETLDKVDVTGGNAVKLYCKDSSGFITNYVSSTEGQNGDWQGFHFCPNNIFIIGFRLRVFPDQGPVGDDFAVDNIQVACSDGTVLDGMDGVVPYNKEEDTQEDVAEERQWEEVNGRMMEAVRFSPERQTRLNGEWGSFGYCSPGLKVAGIRTVVDQGHTFADDAGLTDVIMYCI